MEVPTHNRPDMEEDSLSVSIKNRIKSTTIEAIECFMEATDSMVPTDNRPDMREVESQLRLCDSLRVSDPDHAEALREECIKRQFEYDWDKAFPKCFEDKHGTETTNVKFYIEQAKEILVESELELWEMTYINEPFINRISDLEYLANWFDNAEDTESVLKFVYY